MADYLSGIEQFGDGGGAPAAHALGGASHTADTLANLNGKISDATLIDTGDARLFPEYLFFADQLDSPNNADWTVNNLAAVDTDSNNNALKIRKHDDTAETGFGFIIEIPTGATDVTFDFKSRAETAPGAVRTVGLKVYERDIGDNVAVGAWSPGVVLTDIDIPTNERFQYDTQTLTLAAIGLVAGQTHQLEITRIAPTGGTNLVGNWDLLSVGVKFG